MRKYYNKNSNILRHEKIQDKIFSAKIALSFFIILFLMSAAGITAYAYFSSDVFLNVSPITTAQYDLEYSVTDEENSPEAPLPDGSYFLDAGTYSVSIEPKGSRNAETGFSIVTINNTEYYTSQISTDGESFIFFLAVTGNGKVTVSFAAHWGISSNYPEYDSKDNNIENGAEIIIEAAGDAAGFHDHAEDELPEETITKQERDILSDTTTETQDNTRNDSVTDTTDDHSNDADSSIENSITDAENTK